MDFFLTAPKFPLFGVYTNFCFFFFFFLLIGLVSLDMPIYIPFFFVFVFVFGGIKFVFIRNNLDIFFFAMCCMSMYHTI
ncbi:uncharacterized protein V1513DRAFT_438866 [Lipomyces chichibuensis]|uniref:uncharacterized protein n=1 Tax=Lipomyces chichibuensis TaxID=1546026 RepID=UPI003343E970